MNDEREPALPQSLAPAAHIHGPASSAIEQRLSALEDLLSADKTALDKRIATLEAAAPEKKDRWDKLGILIGPVATVLAGLLITAVGYALTGRVANALEERKLQEVNLTAMRDLLVKLNDADALQTDSEANALALSAYGSYAVAPLITVLNNGGDVRIPSAMQGLRAIGFDSPDAVCMSLASVLSNRTQLYRWQTHRYAIVLLGELDCKEPAVATALRDYKQLMDSTSSADGLKAYQADVRTEDPPTREAIMQLSDSLTRTFELVQR